MSWSKEDETVVQRYLEYTLDVPPHESMNEARDLLEFLADENMLSNDDDIDIAREEGYDEGYSTGYDQGYDEGYVSGKEEEDD